MFQTINEVVIGMSKKISADDAKRILSDCTPEKSFWVNNGPIIKNLNELSATIKSLSETQFSHHINKNKNDFSKWIGEVIGDEELAKAMSKAKTKMAATKKINERLEALKKTVAS